MTHIKLIHYPNWDGDGTGIGSELPGANLEFEIDVTEPGTEVIIKITPDIISINTPFEPKIVPTT